MNKFDLILNKYITEAGSTVTLNLDTATRDATKLKGTQLGNALGQIAGAEQQGVTDPTTIKEPADILHGVLSDDKVNPLTWDKINDSDKAKVIDALVTRKIIPTPQAVTDMGKEKSIESSTSSKGATNYGSNSTQGGTLQGLSNK
jgi:hypothetical protein